MQFKLPPIIKRWLTKRNVLLAAALALMAFPLYVWLTPDNLIRDNCFDKWRAQRAKSGLASSDAAPLGDRTPWVWVHDFGLKSLDEYGPPEHIVRRRFSPWFRKLPEAYREEYPAGGELFDHAKVWQFQYDSSRDPWEVALDLDALIEGDSELTHGRSRIVFSGVSHGGTIIHYYQQVSGGRKLLRAVTSGTPHAGLELADPVVAEDACNDAYPLLGGEVFNLIYLNLDFESPGVQAMLPGNPRLLEAHRRSPLDERWVLYGGLVEPAEGGLLDQAWTSLSLLSAMLLEQDDAQAADLACPVGARIIESCGETSGSDGLVPLRSAQAWGLARGAIRRTFDGYNHRNMLSGKASNPEFYRVLVRDLVTFNP